MRIVREVPAAGAWAAASPYDDHAFEVCVEGDETPDTWEQVVHGDGAGLVFVYRWVPLERGLVLWSGLDSTYEALL